MAFTVDREDSGMLFKNDRKEKETHPDYQGQVNIGGTQMRISAWIKPGKKGKYMSLSFSPVRTEGRTEPVEESKDEFNDDIPFSMALALYVPFWYFTLGETVLQMS